MNETYECRFWSKDEGWSEWEASAPVGFSTPVTALIRPKGGRVGVKRVTFTWPDGEKSQWRLAK